MTAVSPAAVVDRDAPLCLLHIDDAQRGEEECNSIDGDVGGVLLCVLGKKSSNTGWKTTGDVGEYEHTGAIAQLELADSVCRQQCREGWWQQQQQPFGTQRVLQGSASSCWCVGG